MDCQLITQVSHKVEEALAGMVNTPPNIRLMMESMKQRPERPW